MATRILVTGASGFVGRHTLGPLIARGAEVHAVCRGSVVEEVDVQWHSIDLLDRAARRDLVAVVRPEIVLHLAWEARHGVYWTAPSNRDWVAATLEMLGEACDAGGRRFVSVGSCIEYADGAEACDERTTPLAPFTLYGECKDQCRRAAEKAAAAKRMSFAWARLFQLYGPGEHPERLVPSIARQLLGGQAAPSTSGRAVRDFMDVRDAGAALAALALCGVEGPVNVASGQAASVRDVVERLAELAGRPDLPKIGALPDRDERARLVAKVTRLFDEVGYREVRPLDVGLPQALDYWRARVPSLVKSK